MKSLLLLLSFLIVFSEARANRPIKGAPTLHRLGGRLSEVIASGRIIALSPGRIGAPIFNDDSGHMVSFASANVAPRSEHTAPLAAESYTASEVEQEVHELLERLDTRRIVGAKVRDYGMVILENSDSSSYLTSFRRLDEPIFSDNDSPMASYFGLLRYAKQAANSYADIAAEQGGLELLMLELQLMRATQKYLATQSEEEVAGFAVWLATRSEKLWASVRACVGCVTSRVRRITPTHIDAEQLFDTYRREAAEGKNIAAAMFFNNASSEEIEQMLADGADVNRRAWLRETVRETTALMEAVAVGSLEIMRLLLTAGAKVNLQDSRGDTALHRVLGAYWSDIHRYVAVARLIAYGADVDIKNKEGETPRLIAQRTDDKVLGYLIHNGQQWRESFFADYSHTE